MMTAEACIGSLALGAGAAAETTEREWPKRADGAGRRRSWDHLSGNEVPHFEASYFEASHFSLYVNTLHLPGRSTSIAEVIYSGSGTQISF